MKILYNKVTIKGTNKEIKAFVRSLKTLPVKFADTDETEYPDNFFNEEGFFMNSLTPTPEEILSKNYDDNGKSWWLLNWGTEDTLNEAGEVLNSYLSSKQKENSNGYIEFEFNTTRDFCTKWLLEASKVAPNLEFNIELCNDINAFNYFADIKNGVIYNVVRFDNYSEYLYHYVHRGLKSIKDIVDETVSYYIDTFTVDKIVNIFNLEIFLFDDFMWASSLSTKLGFIIRQSIVKSIQERGFDIAQKDEEYA